MYTLIHSSLCVLHIMYHVARMHTKFCRNCVYNIKGWASLMQRAVVYEDRFHPHGAPYCFSFISQHSATRIPRVVYSPPPTLHQPPPLPATPSRLYMHEKPLKAGHCTLVCTIIAGLIAISNQEDALFTCLCEWLIAWSASWDGTRVRLCLKWPCLPHYFDIFEPDVLMVCLWLEMWWT